MDLEARIDVQEDKLAGRDQGASLFSDSAGFLTSISTASTIGSMNMTSTEMISIIPLFVSLIGFFFLFKHMKELNQRKTVVLPPVSNSGSPASDRIFDLSQEKNMNIDFYFFIGALCSIFPFLVIVLGGALIHYLFTNWYLIHCTFSFLSAVLSFGSVWGLKHLVQLVRELFKALALSKSTRCREIIFEETKVRFSIGLIESNDVHELTEQGKAYLEIPYMQVKEVQGLQPNTTHSRSTPGRIVFHLHDSDKTPAIKIFPFGKFEKDIIEELRRRIPATITLNAHPGDPYHSAK